MDCKALRQKLVELTGRYDLVKTVGSDTWVDDGANWFLTKGQEMLDRMWTAESNHRSHVAVLAAGEFQVPVERMRALERVYTHTTQGGRRDLELIEAAAARSLYGSWEEMTDGTPTYATHLPAGLSPELNETARATLETAGATDLDGKLFEGADTTHDLIVVLPAPVVQTTVFIEGWWYSPAFADDDTLTWWSVRHPETVLKAACYQIESFMRNTQGMNDWMAGIQHDLTQLDHQDVLENYGTGVMKG